jgi:hypothetical protein
MEENTNNQLAQTGFAGSSFTEVGLPHLANTTNPYHLRRKLSIPEELVNQALANKPFNGLTFVVADNIPVHEHELLADGFLEREFHFLKEIGVSLSEPSNEMYRKLVSDTVKIYRGQGLDGQVFTIENDYKCACATRTIFNFTKKAIEDDKFDHTHLSLLQSVNEVFKSLEAGQRTFVLEGLAKICEWNSLRGKYRTPTALSKKYLPELFMSCPVWFVQGNDVDDIENQDDPLPDEFTRFICDMVGTKDFAWMYQMYNRRTRAFDKFKGPDIMPPHVTEHLAELGKVFDYLVIATPYHDIASKEWADPAWQRNLDPYLLGFKIGLPYVVMIERWSGTGLFPLVTDMIADTISHIQKNVQNGKLGKFSESTFWYKGQGSNPARTTLGTNLTGFGQAIVDSFNQGTLLDALREEIL